MNLEERTKDDLKSLLKEYCLKKADISFFYESIAILNQDSLFQNRLKTNLTYDIFSDMSISTKSLEIEINPQTYEKRINKDIKELVKYQYLERQIRTFNMFFLYGILHEVKHFNQMEMALGRVSTQDFVRQAHRIWYEFITLPTSEHKQQVYALYNQYHNFMFFEREADITSLKIVKQLFDDSLLKRYCNRNLVINYKLGYINKGPFVKSPVEYTSNLFGSVFDVTTVSNLPFLDKFEIGFPLDANEYQQMVNVFTARFDSNEEMIKKLKKIA